MVTQTLLTVRYAETDRMGIAHHSHYPVWFEQARTEFVTRCGLTYSQMEQEGVLTPCRSFTAVFCPLRAMRTGCWWRLV